MRCSYDCTILTKLSALERVLLLTMMTSMHPRRKLFLKQPDLNNNKNVEAVISVVKACLEFTNHIKCGFIFKGLNIFWCLK